MHYRRVISLTPSLTETIFALGAEGRLAGVTDSCDYPAAANDKPHVCSWFHPDIERIAALKPDLVLGLTPTHASLATALKIGGIECVLFNPSTVEQTLNDMERLAALLSLPRAGQALVAGLRRRLAVLDTEVRHLDPEEKRTVLRVLDSNSKGLIVAGPKSFQFDIIARAGGTNVTGTIDAPYPTIDYQLLQRWDPFIIFVCGTDPDYQARFAATPGWQNLKAVRQRTLYQFDCGLTCRTGPRIVDMAELLFTTLYGRE